MASDLSTEDKINLIRKTAISLIVIGTACADITLVLLGYVKINDPNVAVLVGAVIGYVVNMAQQCVSFDFGTTKTSSDKDKAILDSVSKIPVATSTVTATKTETTSPTIKTEETQS